ncbi:hypothetical protein AMURIS_00040 [Acetatifactor muris]|uniref:Uncharacterized protein n=1 Tax=Acetatifactor muris TaxID=879566 RepID=A0A2K4ZA35_9FIRM|nr:hypothetical protein AMURIS_00040 [Acetatifactor muris]
MNREITDGRFCRKAAVRKTDMERVNEERKITRQSRGQNHRKGQ